MKCALLTPPEDEEIFSFCQLVSVAVVFAFVERGLLPVLPQFHMLQAELSRGEGGNPCSAEREGGYAPGILMTVKSS